MKNWSKLLPTLLVIFTGFLFSQRANAQCTLTISGSDHGCSPAGFSFLRTDNSGKKITSWAWSYGDGSTSSDTATHDIHQYSKPGSYTVTVTVTYSDGSKCTATCTKVVHVYAPPVPVMFLPSVFPNDSIQCYKRNGLLNSFLFTEGSTPGSSGAPILFYLWNFGDGDTSTTHEPTHTYQAPGTYTASLRITDSNGCSAFQSKNASIIVLKDIKATFIFSATTGCDSANETFTNTTDTTNLFMTSFEWDFGDGSPPDINDFNPVHKYKAGDYVATLTITNKLGCQATASAIIKIPKFEIKLFYKDSICWNIANGNGITFVAEQQPNVIFWQWNFGDPNSGNNNIVNYAWATTHKFAGGPSVGGIPNGLGVAIPGAAGPGIYQVNFLMINSNNKCGKNGQLDTCVLVHIKGPMEVINLPGPVFPQNTIVTGVKMPKTVFTNIANNPGSCPPDSVWYSTYKKAAGPSAHVTYTYCDADTFPANKPDTALRKIALAKFGKDSIGISTTADCYGKHAVPYVSSIALMPTGSKTKIYTDSTEITSLWTKHVNPIPTGNTYYPTIPALAWNNMNDTNMVTCYLPNLVRFTNNSVKYRLQEEMDNYTWINVLDQPHSFQDTCRWKNYPFASDSLTYYWSFYDPTGQNCTSGIKGVNFKNWNCNFSTLCTPYHYYKGPNAPATRCQNVRLTVYDPVTNCQDSNILQLHQGIPDAYWNRSAYCKMTWEMQSSQLAPKGSAGTGGPPLIGFELDQQANECTGGSYHFQIDLGQTLPTCGATNWWVTFDSANTTKSVTCGGYDYPKSLDHGFLGVPALGYTPGKNSYPAAAPSSFWQGLPWLGYYWYEEGDSGCKTIGLVLQNGSCFDTAWYHDYICFNKLAPDFTLFNAGNVARRASHKNKFDTVSLPTILDTFYQCGQKKNHGIAAKDFVFGNIIAIDSADDATRPHSTSNVTRCDTSEVEYKVVGAQYIDNSALNSHGHICQTGKGGRKDDPTNQRQFYEGVKLWLFPADTNQRDVTKFQYSVQRMQYDQNPTFTGTDGWYFDNTSHGLFWPDSASLLSQPLTAYTSTGDSIKQIDYKIYYIDTPYLYIILNEPGLPAHRVLYNFPLYQENVDSLAKTYHSASNPGHFRIYIKPIVKEIDSTYNTTTRQYVRDTIWEQDERARLISATCTDYITVYASKLAIKGGTQILNLKGFGAVDSFVLPYPGFYTVQARTQNLQGCNEAAQYQLIYGHYATFNANNDSIVCVGSKVNFNYYVRYWSTTCPPPPGGGGPPPGCLNGADEEIFTAPGVPISDGIDFKPWDTLNPTAYRDSLTGGFFKNNPPKTHAYQPEQMWWNFGEDTTVLGRNTFNKVPTGSKISHVYTKPGTYTVSMRTIDWRGCAVTTVRRNLISVIAPIANFALVVPGDTFNYCAPKSIQIKDKTVLLGASHYDSVVSHGVIIDTLFTVDSITDKYWSPGDGRVIHKTSDSFVTFDYTKNGVFTVGLTVKTAVGCGSFKTVPGYITLVGPTPSFDIISARSGCAPFTVRILSHNDKQDSANTYFFGDATKLFPNPYDPDTETVSTEQTTHLSRDTLFSYTYNAPRGHFRISEEQTDTFRDFAGHKLPPCNVFYPPIDTNAQYWITIYPHSVVKIVGDTLLCVNKPGKYNAISQYGEYKHWWWDHLGNNDSTTILNDSSQTFTWTTNDYNAAAARGDTDAIGRAVFKMKVYAESDTGGAPTGCTMAAYINVHVENSYAAFKIDSSAQKLQSSNGTSSGSNVYTFINESKHAVKYTWNFGDGDSIVTTDGKTPIQHSYKTNSLMPDTVNEGLQNPTPFITYRVVLRTISANGCPKDTFALIKILREYQHYNVFTPNGDNINDKFVPAIEGATSYDIKIFNRWGQQVFESTNAAINWDGNNQATGAPCPEGAYYYIWKFTLIDGVSKTINGAVSLIR